jgi:TM2 domain-containing membrane protein YozV
MKNKGTAYLLWLLSIFGWLGFHHFYLGKILKGIIWILTFGFFGFGSLIDLFTLGNAVDNYNTKQELDTIRASSLASLSSHNRNSSAQHRNHQAEELEVQSDSRSSYRDEQNEHIEENRKEWHLEAGTVKPLLMLLVVFIVGFSAFSLTKWLMYEDGSISQSDQTVRVVFTNTIGGYDVQVSWIPMQVKYDYIVGPAILMLSNVRSNEKMSLVVNNFSIPQSKLQYSDENDIIRVLSDTVFLTFEKVDLFGDNGFDSIVQPIYLQDVDFDYSDELLIPEVGAGQRGGSSVKVWKITKYGFDLQYRQITYQEPFVSFDDFTKVDYQNKEIRIYSSGGSCFNSTLVYKLYSETFEGRVVSQGLKVDRIIEEVRNDETGECFKVTSRLSENKETISIVRQ